MVYLLMPSWSSNKWSIRFSPLDRQWQVFSFHCFFHSFLHTRFSISPFPKAFLPSELLTKLHLLLPLYLFPEPFSIPTRQMFLYSFELSHHLSTFPRHGEYFWNFYIFCVFLDSFASHINFPSKMEMIRLSIYYLSMNVWKTVPMTRMSCFESQLPWSQKVEAEVEEVIRKGQWIEFS